MVNTNDINSYFLMI